MSCLATVPQTFACSHMLQGQHEQSTWPNTGMPPVLPQPHLDAEGRILCAVAQVGSSDEVHASADTRTCGMQRPGGKCTTPTIRLAARELWLLSSVTASRHAVHCYTTLHHTNYGLQTAWFQPCRSDSRVAHFLAAHACCGSHQAVRPGEACSESVSAPAVRALPTLHSCNDGEAALLQDTERLLCSSRHKQAGTGSISGVCTRT